MLGWGWRKGALALTTVYLKLTLHGKLSVKPTNYLLRQFPELLGWVVTCNSKHPNRTTDDDGDASDIQTQPHSQQPRAGEGIILLLYKGTAEATKRGKESIKSYLAGKAKISTAFDDLSLDAVSVPRKEITTIVSFSVLKLLFS